MSDMSKKFVDGDNHGEVMLYALSTCVWCKKTKELLNELGVAYTYTDVDKLEKEQRTAAVEEVKKWNPDCSYPSMVVDKKECIVGFDEDRIREVLG